MRACCGGSADIQPWDDRPGPAPLVEAEWLLYESSDGSVRDLDGLRRRLHAGGGIEAGLLRERLWRHLCGVVPWEASAADIERILEERRAEYSLLKARWVGADKLAECGADKLAECGVASLVKYHRVIDGDVLRTDRKHPDWQEEAALFPLKAILYTFCCHPLGEALGYFQGMNDIAAVICSVVPDEASRFWCFEGFIRHREEVFMDFPRGLWARLQAVDLLLAHVEPSLSSSLKAANGGSSEFPFLFQATFLLLKREMLDYEATARLWESVLAHHQRGYDVYIVAALLRSQRSNVPDAADLAELVQLFNGLVGTIADAGLLFSAQKIEDAAMKDPDVLAKLQAILA